MYPCQEMMENIDNTTLAYLDDQFRVDACIELMTSYRNYQWLHGLTIGNEKWFSYVNYTRQRQWREAGQTDVATLSNDLHPKKVMLSVWYGLKGIIHWGFLPNGFNMTVFLYCQQLNRVQEKLQKK